MQVEELVLRVCGFDDDGERVRVYFDEPNAPPPLGWEQGVRSSVFRDLNPQEAGEFRRYLGQHRKWEYLRVQPAPQRCSASAWAW
jgi:hypothetical protein